MVNFIKTTCPYCGVGCGLLLMELDGNLIGTIPQIEHPVNQGSLCVKGWNAHEFVQSEKRLTKPLVRKNGELQEASWDEAIDVTAKSLKSIKDKYGSESLAFFSCSRATNEENFLLMKLARSVFGSNNVDNCARV